MMEFVSNYFEVVILVITSVMAIVNIVFGLAWVLLLGGAIMSVMLYQVYKTKKGEVENV